jgi:hypothetical protein
MEGNIDALRTSTRNRRAVRVDAESVVGEGVVIWDLIEAIAVPVLVACGLLFLAFIVAGLFGAWDSPTLDEAKALREACERDLPRSQTCRMIYVPEARK